MAEEKGESPKMEYYMLLVPNHGDCSILSFDKSKDMIKQLTSYLRDKESGAYVGEIFLFYGKQIEFSDPILSYRVNDPESGELSVSEGTKGKYLGQTAPETEVLPALKSEEKSG